MKVTVIGAGAWGTALALVLSQNGHAITLWGHHAQRLEEMKRTRSNAPYLPGIVLPEDWRYETDLDQAINGSECLVIAVPSKAFRDVTSRLASFQGLAVSVTKGIELETGLTMSGVMRQTIPGALVSALSGPTLALEVAREIPAAVVAANPDPAAARIIQNLFHRPPCLRVYTSYDLLGVELAGALKNVIAIGAGVCDGLGFGDNTKAALITRAIAEIRRLGVACGAHPETFAGLSGLGDLTVTCFSRLSRNRGFGERVGRGEKASDIVRTSTAVAEGYPTARSAFQLARKMGVCTPIIDEVYAMLYLEKNVQEALHDLMARDSKAED